MPQFSDDLYLGPAQTYMGTNAALVYANTATASALVSGASSTGFAVGDTLQVLGGTGTPAVITVSAVSSGAVTAFTLTSGGNYSAVPVGTLNTAILTSATGGGTLPTVTLTFGQTAVPSYPSPMGQGVGPLGRVYVFDICPSAPSATALAAAQSTTASTAMTLTAGSGTGVTQATSITGATVYVLDVARTVSFTTSSVAITASVLTISGFDIYGAAMTEAVSVPTTASTTTSGKKAFKTIVSITPSVTNTSTKTISAGVSNVYGLPVRVTDAAYVADIGWAQSISNDSGTFVAAVQGTATSTTGDVRGTYAPSSNANGTYRLVMGIYMPAIAVGPNATQTGAIGVTQA